MVEYKRTEPSSTHVSRRTPIWAAIHTPFLASGSIDSEGIRHNIRSYIATGLDGVFCNGLMGEVWALDLNERKVVLETIIDEAKDRLGVSVVVTASSIDETIELGKHAKKIGATHAVLTIPPMGPRSNEQLFSYFEYIHDQLDMPLVIFNAATISGSLINPEMFAKLCELPNLKILKTTASEEENLGLRSAKRNGVLVSDPLEEHFLLNMKAHAQSILFADPEPYLYQDASHRPIDAYVSLMENGQVERAQQKFELLSVQREVYNKWIMDPLKRNHMPNAALKYWSEMKGLAGGVVRAPLVPLSEEEQKELHADLVRCGLVESKELTCETN
ncbi:dihydrodipicolinate synthase family protein [Sporosarcina sp. CAU 1771]